MGFLVFGICAIILGLPLLCFPKTLVPKKTTRKNDKHKENIKITCGAVYRDFKSTYRDIILIVSSDCNNETSTVSYRDCLYVKIKYMYDKRQ